MDDTAKKGAGGQNQRPTGIMPSIFSDNAAHMTMRTIFFGMDVAYRTFDNRKIAICFELPLYRLTVQFPVSLGTRSMYRGTAGFVQHPELNARRINRQPHQAIKRVYFPDKMAFAKPANRRIA